MIDVGAEVLERGFDAGFDDFELTVITEGGLLVNLDLGCSFMGFESPPIEAR